MHRFERCTVYAGVLHCSRCIKFNTPPRRIQNWQCTNRSIIEGAISATSQFYSVKGSAIALAIVGVLLMLFGFVFELQGLGTLGPTNGFMYNNVEWVYGGGALVVVGILILGAGLYLNRRRATPA